AVRGGPERAVLQDLLQLLRRHVLNVGLPGLQQLHPAGVDVKTGDAVADGCRAHGQRQSHVTEADHDDLGHARSPGAAASAAASGASAPAGTAVAAGTAGAAFPAGPVGAGALATGLSGAGAPRRRMR